MPRQRIDHSREDHDIPEDFPERLKRFKEDSGLSWSEIARRLGTYRSTVQRWDEGRTRVPGGMADRRARPCRKTTAQERANVIRKRAIGRKAFILVPALVALLLLPAGAPVAAHGGPVPDKPTGLTAMGFHGGIALHHDIVNPYVALSWDDPGDTGITHYQIHRRNLDTHAEGRFVIIHGDAAQTGYSDHAVEKNMHYVYRIVAVNAYGESPPSGSAEADTYLVAIVPFPGLDDESSEE